MEITEVPEGKEIVITDETVMKMLIEYIKVMGKHEVEFKFLARPCRRPKPPKDRADRREKYPYRSVFCCKEAKKCGIIEITNQDDREFKQYLSQ